LGVGSGAPAYAGKKSKERVKPVRKAEKNKEKKTMRVIEIMGEK